MKSVSKRISGVKNFESQTASLLRAVPLSQVQSAKAKGTDGSGLADAEEVPVACCATDTGVAADTVAFTETAGAVTSGAEFVEAGTVVFGAEELLDGTAASVDTRLFNSALSWSISACMAASCFATAGEISGSGADVAALASEDAIVGGSLLCALHECGEIKLRMKTRVSSHANFLHAELLNILVVTQEFQQETHKEHAKNA
jgi:hypothetical protein